MVWTVDLTSQPARAIKGRWMGPDASRRPPERAPDLRFLGSGRRDSNPRPQPWQGCALPTEPRPRCLYRLAPSRAPAPGVTRGPSGLRGRDVRPSGGPVRQAGTSPGVRPRPWPPRSVPNREQALAWLAHNAGLHHLHYGTSKRAGAGVTRDYDRDHLGIGLGRRAAHGRG
jgi:hypothetical protein